MNPRDKFMLTELLKYIVIEEFDTTYEAFHSRGRHHYKCLLPRQTYYYILWNIRKVDPALFFTLKDIGGTVNFDHATVINGRKRIEDSMELAEITGKDSLLSGKVKHSMNRIKELIKNNQ